MKILQLYTYGEWPAWHIIYLNPVFEKIGIHNEQIFWKK